MAHRYPHRRGLGDICDQLHWFAHQTARAAHVCRALVLPGVDHYRRRAAHFQQPRDSRRTVQELQHLRRCAGRVHAVVVRAQRGGVFSHHAVPGDDVLLHAQGGGGAGLQLQAVDSALLDVGVHVHLGRPAPLALHGPARVGLHVRHALLDHALGTVVGWHDQRSPDAAGCVAQGGRRPGPQVHGPRPHRLRHDDLRGTDAFHQVGECAVALHRLDHRPRALGGPYVERFLHIRDDLLARPAPVPDGNVQQETDEHALLDRDRRRGALHPVHLLGWCDAGAHVARLRRDRAPAVSGLRRDRGPPCSDVLGACGGRNALSRRRRALRLQYFQDVGQTSGSLHRAGYPGPGTLEDIHP